MIYKPKEVDNHRIAWRAEYVHIWRGFCTVRCCFLFDDIVASTQSTDMHSSRFLDVPCREESVHHTQTDLSGTTHTHTHTHVRHTYPNNRTECIYTTSAIVFGVAPSSNGEDFRTVGSGHNKYTRHPHSRQSKHTTPTTTIMHTRCSAAL